MAPNHRNNAVIGRTRPTKPKKQQRTQKRKRDDVDVETLEQGVSELDVQGTTYTSFSDLPLSAPTTAGLKSGHFSTLTDIQAKAVPLALKGHDILGAAKTGSGKTLAFLIPVLENLYRAQCVGADAGLGAMIISPTRELAIQIFEVLRKVGGKGHLFAAGLVIGGKGLNEERDALARMNIVVCTPGRILQHLSQTALFNVDNLRMLVLDEADRILDMGFQRDLDAILDYLPADRQTMLFSATQTKKVSDLARLSLKEPEYVAVHESATSATPKTLQQNYVITPLPDKLDTLWSFLQSSKKSKILVFLSSGKQVRFVYESFRHMQPGIPLLHLHGRQKQTARLDITDKFSRAKHSCLFATDVVARGLDFPAVDWVVQVDCPEDADTYIHRVGRTARYERNGRAVLFLDPSEEAGFLGRLEQKRVPVERINVKQNKQKSIRDQMQKMCFEDPQLKYLGQKAFASYVRSLHVQKDKDVFHLEKYDLEGFAASMGLPGAPRIKFLKADPEEQKRRKNASRQVMEDESEGDEVEAGSDVQDDEEVLKAKKKDGVRTKYDRMFERKNQDVFADHYAKMIRDDEAKANGKAAGEDEKSDAGDDLFAVKRRIPAETGSDSPSSDEEEEGQDAAPTNEAGVDPSAKTVNVPGAKQPLVLDSKRREKLLKSKKKLLKLKDQGKKVLFDEEGQPHQLYELEDEDQFKARGAAEDQRKRFLEEEKERVQKADEADKATAKEKKKAKREKRKERERAEAGDEDEDDAADGPPLEDTRADFANFLNSLGGEEDGDREQESGDEEAPKSKKQKKWFQKDDESDEEAAPGTKRARRDGGDQGGKEIETFDDLEAEAAKLLG
ncbi:ATP-dependent RNA helicase [Hortaea werneckii]|nr:ATP-dependent RNA helicase [Hortaea werneckii]KAI7324942.1 ATP-dependent RNA helicase [Hortaea werneckii]